MKKSIKMMLAGLLLVPMFALGVTTFAGVQTANAAPATDCSGDATTGLNSGVACARGNDTPATLFGDGGIFTTIVNILLYIIGAIAVIMLIFGGIRYVISGGDATAVTAAKNTILYAVVGIVVAILAYAIVNFVIGGIATNG